MTQKDFGRLVAVIRGVYQDKEFLAEREAAEIWYEMLKDIPYEQARAAVVKHSMTNRWVPKIADIREQVVDIQTDKADWADGWEQVMTAVRRFGYTNEKAALESLHPMAREAAKRLGWQQICMTDADQLMTTRANFRMIYEKKSEQEKESAQLPTWFKEKAQSITERSGDWLEQNKLLP